MEKLVNFGFFLSANSLPWHKMGILSPATLIFIQPFYQLLTETVT